MSSPGTGDGQAATARRLRREAVVRTAGGIAIGAVGAHLLVSGLGAVLGLDPLGLLAAPLGVALVVVAAGLLVEAGVRAARVAMTRGRARRTGRTEESPAAGTPGDD